MDTQQYVTSMLRKFGTGLAAEPDTVNADVVSLPAGEFAEIEIQAGRVKRAHFFTFAEGKSLDYLLASTATSRLGNISDEDFRHFINTTFACRAACGTVQDIRDAVARVVDVPSDKVEIVERLASEALRRYSISRFSSLDEAALANSPANFSVVLRQFPRNGFSLQQFYDAIEEVRATGVVFIDTSFNLVGTPLEITVYTSFTRINQHCDLADGWGVNAWGTMPWGGTLIYLQCGTMQITPIEAAIEAAMRRYTLARFTCMQITPIET
jgi:hypothetical protein